MAGGIGGVLEQLILPPGGFIIAALLGLLLMPRYPRSGRHITLISLALLYLASLPISATLLLSWLEPANALTQNVTSEATEQPPQAIVILGAGRRHDSPEYGSDIPNAMALERIRYGVWLARRSLLPVLVSGGLGDDEHPPEAQMMKRLIEEEYALAVRWIETQSHTTYENAKYTADILKAEGITSIYLVTHAVHMQRSVKSFEKFGLIVHPAPTAFGGSSQRELELSAFLPSAKALHHTSMVFHEWVGLLWYRLRYGV